MLDQQWIHAMLRLSNKAVALIIQIEKQYTCCRATVCCASRRELTGRMRAVRRAGRREGVRAGV